MSHFFGYIEKKENNLDFSYAGFDRHSFNGVNLFVKSETATGYKSSSKDYYCYLAGNPIIYDDDFKHIEDRYLDKINYDYNFDEFDGWYAGIKVKDNTLLLFTDILGIRDVHFSETDEYIFFGTDIRVINSFCKIISYNIKVNEIKYLAAKSMFNQMDRKSLITGLDRLCGDILEYNIETNNYNKKTFNLDFFNIQQFNLIELAESFNNYLKNLNKEIYFGLSGGFDSRFTYSLIFGEDKINTFYIGSSASKEFQISKALSIMISKKHLELDLPDKDLSRELSEFISLGLGQINMSDFLTTTVFQTEMFPNSVLIDGSCAAIARRKILIRLSSKAHLYQRIPSADFLLDFLTTNNKYLSNNYASKIEEERKIQVEELFRIISMYNSNYLNQVDLLYFYCRASNFFGRLISIIDNYNFTHTPFLMKHFIAAALKVPLSSRKNEKFARYIIHNKNKHFESEPLMINNQKLSYNLKGAKGWYLAHFFDKIKGHQEEVSVFEKLKINKNRDFELGLLKGELSN